MPTYHPTPATPKLNDSERTGGRSAGRRPGAGSPGKHIAAIHALKNKLRMPDEEYRALLFGQTGKHSCKDMTVPERQRVREHLQQLARRAGLERAGAQPRRAKAARPLEGKVWALWHALGRAGKLDRSDAAALRAWVRRQVGVDDIGWCSNAQLHSLIESLKLWQGR